MTDDSNTNDAGAETKRTRGRPTIAELEAREAALKQREAEIAAKEEEAALLTREAELRLAEAKADLREADLSRAEAKAPPQTFVPGRSASVRADTARSEDITQPVRRRRYHGGEMPNEFHIPPEHIPDGISYQWNNHTVFGMTNPSSDAHMQMQGWEPVPAERHPYLMPKGYDPKGPIIVKGQILVERPVELTREALQEDYDRAVGEVRMKEQQLYGTPEGTLPRQRANGSNDFIAVQRTVERGEPSKPNYRYEDGGGIPVE